MQLFDSHTHQLDAPAGRAVINIPNKYLLHLDRFVPREGCLYSAGLHPYLTKDWEASLNILRQLLEHHWLYAIGECGLDKRSQTPLERQIMYLEQQMKWADQYELPLILHCVKAWDELIDLHRKHPSHCRRIIHAFRGKPQQAKSLLRQGFFLSFGPRFNAESIKKCPLERRLIETDDSGQTIEKVFVIQNQVLKGK